MPKPLDIERLRKFDNSQASIYSTDPAPLEKARSSIDRWPSREPIRDGQMSIKAPLDVIERFKRICKDDRRTYADMLRILMDQYEAKG